MIGLYLIALAITLAIELPLLVLISKKAPRSSLWDGLLANLCSHPAAVFSVWVLGCPLLIAELAVWLVEAAVYRQLQPWSWRKALLVSGSLNLITALLSALFVGA